MITSVIMILPWNTLGNWTVPNLNEHGWCVQCSRSNFNVKKCHSCRCQSYITCIYIKKNNEKGKIYVCCYASTKQFQIQAIKISYITGVIVTCLLLRKSKMTSMCNFILRLLWNSGMEDINRFGPFMHICDIGTNYQRVINCSAR